MSQIQTNLNKIKTAVYGVEVRDAIHDSIEQCYDDVSAAKTKADNATTAANTAASNANAKAAAAETAAQNANAAATAVETNAQSVIEAINRADTAAASAKAQATAAETAAQNANAAATNAETQASAAQSAATEANTAAENANAKAIAANDAAEAAAAATTDLEGLKTEVTTAAQNANEKAELASEKATEAITAVSDVEALKTAATNAAALANEKAELANEKANAANTAASNADAAKDRANAAATNVESSIVRATNAADKAEKSATKADTAAALANTKAELADEKANAVESKANAAVAATTAANSAAESANTAAQNANEKANLVESTITAAESAANAANTAAQNADDKAGKANAAATKADVATADARDAIDEMTTKTSAIETSLLTKVDDGYVENGYLYLTANGQVVVGPLGPFSGAGTGGASNNAVLTMTNTTGWLAKTVAFGSDCTLRFTWSSLEEELATGNGTVFVTVNGALRLTRNVPQGETEVNVKDFLTAGVNTIRVKVSDVYGNSRSMNFTVTTIEAMIRSSFDASSPFSGAITYTYTPTGKVEKTVHFVLDGKEIGTQTVSTSGRQQSYVIPAQTHGAHSLLVYYTATIDTEQIRSNELYYSLICVSVSNDTPIIASPFRQTTAKQYEILKIPYTVYNPTSLTAEVQLSAMSANGELVSTQTVNRTQQVWTYRADDAGDLFLIITCGDVISAFYLNVSETDMNVEAETNDLALYLSSYGRSNNEANPGTWTSGSITSTFAGFNFTSDGWQNDEQGVTVLRLSGDARLNVGYKPFETDFRGTGKTIEIEFGTRDVLNYDAVIANWMSGGRGIEITAQKATLKSEQAEIGTQFKENEHIRLSFVVEKKNENRLMYIYINGIMTGAVQYPADDDFSQSAPVNITFGSNECTMDIYCIRVYDNNLTRHQILDNWIADTQNIDDKLARYNRNDIFDVDGSSILISKLPVDLPYLYLTAPALPTYKGNKLPVDGYYSDRQNQDKSFEFSGATADVQGTSSAGYARKNYKIKFDNGFVVNDVTQADYQMRDDSVATKTFTFKADVASSEGANNVELARLYNAICPYKTPPQKADSSIRQGIDGFPIIIFHDDGTNTRFVGKYNFNNDKGTPEVYGFAVGDESWEILNNTSDRVLWKNADFSGTEWQNDFEARYPEDNTDVQNLAAFAAWLVSTDQTAATNSTLETPVTYDEVSYTTDSAEYRLAKFKAELANYVEIDSTVFYYLFTELFLMVDSRAKNAFPSKFGTGKICWLPYDFDTAIGINNEGALAFSYHLEDIDQIGSGANVFNGQNSVLWVNLRQAFFSQIRAMYQKLRSDGVLSYDIVEKAYEAHQSKWPEAIWNEDAYYKYLQPLIDDGTGAYLSMLQGSKEEQRKWWLYNRFRYMDAKYNAGDSLSDIVTLRGYAKADITIEPYADIYASVKYGSYLQQVRALRGGSYTLPCPLTNVNDTEIYIYSASQIKSIGDLSGLKVGYAEFSHAIRLQSLKLGDGAEDYSNGNLTELYLGNNSLLRTLDVRNCPNLKQSINASGCSNLETAWFTGTAITGLSLPNGGIVKELKLPGTLTNFTIRNQKKLETVEIGGYGSLTTLFIESTPNLPIEEIITGASQLSRVRLVDVDWTATSQETLQATIDKLIAVGGLDENGQNTPNAIVTGKVRVPSITNELLFSIIEHFPELLVIANGAAQYLARYYDWDGTLLYTAVVAGGGTPINPVETGAITAPTRPDSETQGYVFRDFGELPTNVQGNCRLTAQYTDVWFVKYVNSDGTVLQTKRVPNGEGTSYSGSTPTKASTAQYTYSFSGWSSGGTNGAITNVTNSMTITAQYTSTVRTYTVYFYNGSTLLQTITNVAYGGSATYTGDTPVSPDDGYEFTGWNPQPTNITGNTSCYAQFGTPMVDEEITDDWETIRKNVANGIHTTKYKVGNYKSIDLGNKGVINMQIVALGKDTLADGSGAAPITWIGKELLAKTTHRMNPTLSGSEGAYTEGTGAIGGWEKSEMRTYLRDTIKPLIPAVTRKQIKAVSKTSLAVDTAKKSFQQQTSDDVWIPSHREIYKSSEAEKTGPMYSAVYKDNASRAKQESGKTISDMWWLRSAFGNNYGEYFRIVAANGGDTLSDSSINRLFPLGFATGADTIADSWDEIIASMDDGTYATKYAVGDTKLLDLGSEGIVCATLVGIDMDNLTGGGGKAKMTWLTEQLLNTNHRMNPSRSGSAGAYIEGTGAVGGWDKCEMRTYLKNTIKPLIPEAIRNRIAEVTKVHPAYNTSGGNSFMQITRDDVWLPSYDEIFSTDGLYHGVFPDNASRIKQTPGNTSANNWWLRSADGVPYFDCVGSNGGLVSYGAGELRGVVLGFCLN